MESCIRLQGVRKPIKLDTSSYRQQEEMEQREISVPNSSSIANPLQPILEERNQTGVDTNPTDSRGPLPTNGIELQTEASPSLTAFASQHDSLISSAHPRLVPILPARFNGKNYYSWKHQMEFLLGQMNLAYVLTEPFPSCSLTSGPAVEETVQAKAVVQKWVDDDYICRHYILNSLSDDLFNEYSKKTFSAKELWEEFKSMYEEDFGTKRAEVNKYIQFQMADGVSVCFQVEELHKIASSLMASGVFIDEYFHVSAIISKLPPSWKEFRQRLMCEQFLPFNMLMHRLRIEEEARFAKAVGKSSKAAHVMERKLDSRFDPRRNETKRLCYCCGKEGHISRYCPDKRLEVRKRFERKDNGDVPVSTEDSGHVGITDL